MQSNVLKWGNSLAIRLPKAVAEQARLREGDPLEIVVGADAVEIRRASELPTLPELVAKITPENRYGEISLGRSIGREIVEW